MKEIKTIEQERIETSKEEVDDDENTSISKINDGSSLPAVMPKPQIHTSPKHKVPMPLLNSNYYMRCREYKRINNENE